MKLLVVAAVALVFAPVAVAQHETFIVNPNASEVKMTLKTTHEVVNGTFHVQSGLIDFDPKTGKMAGTAVVLAGSGNTGNGSRDRRMNNDILLVQQHATLSFEPKSYVGTIAMPGDSTIQVAGVFTLLGTPHEISLPMLVHVTGTSATVKAHFLVPYVQWGLKDPSFLVWRADKDVAIDLLLTGSLSK